MSTTPETEDAPVIDDDSAGAPEAPENADVGEIEKLNKAAEIIAKVAKEGEASGFTVDAVAEAAYFFRSSKLTAPFRFAWSATPAFLQRELAGAEQTAIGEFFMRYLPMLNPRAYFVPGLLLGGLAKVGVIEFKLNDEEDKAMQTELDSNPSEAAKAAHKAKVEDGIADRIVHPGQGMLKVITGPLGAVISTAQPELAPAVAVAKAGDVIEGAREGYLAQVRERVHALELETAQQKDAAEKSRTAVPGIVVVEHNTIAAGLEPQVHIPPLPEEEGYEDIKPLPIKGGQGSEAHL